MPFSPTSEVWPQPCGICRLITANGTRSWITPKRIWNTPSPASCAPLFRSDALLANFRSLAAALRDLQADNGEWHTVLDHPETYLEHSIACFVCAAFPI